jgi:hypothetical protein
MLDATIEFIGEQYPGRWALRSGTLLGERRHNGTTMPWDTDADLNIIVPTFTSFDEFEATIERPMARFNDWATERNLPYRMTDCLRQEPYHQIQAWNMSGLYCSQAFKVYDPAFGWGNRQPNDPIVDISFLMELGDRIVEINSHWRNFHWKREWILPLRPCPFRSSWLCPADTDAWLHYLYGPTVLTELPALLLPEEEEAARAEPGSAHFRSFAKGGPDWLSQAERNLYQHPLAHVLEVHRRERRKVRSVLRRLVFGWNGLLHLAQMLGLTDDGPSSRKPLPFGAPEWGPGWADLHQFDFYDFGCSLATDEVCADPGLRTHCQTYCQVQELVPLCGDVLQRIEESCPTEAVPLPDRSPAHARSHTAISAFTWLRRWRFVKRWTWRLTIASLVFFVLRVAVRACCFR